MEGSLANGRRDPAGAAETSLDETIDERVAEAVIDAYYPRAIAIAETARNRAQAAYAIVSALAGGTVAGVLLTMPESRPILTRVLGCVAMAAWLFAAGLYLMAIAVPVQIDKPWTPERGGGRRGPRSEFVQRVLERVRDERDKVDQRQMRANWVAGGALVLTTLTLTSAVLLPPPEEERHATIVLNAQGQKAVATLCSRQSSTVDGKLVIGSLKEGFASLTVDPPTCGARPTVLRIPSKFIVSTRYGPA
jgi:hypothetical protein